jgi:hypothetical protein
VAILTINRGLVTSPNELTKPDGAAEVLDNCVIDFDNIVQSRRGFGEFGNKIDDDSVAKQLLTYKGRILRHFSNKLSFDSTGNGSFLNFSGSYSELVSRLRIKYFELNSNLYFTTSEGIKKISATSADDFTTAANYIIDAGGVKAVSIAATIAPAASGFLPAQSKVAYKVLWARKDANGNVVRGVPSSRYVITNASQDTNTGEKFKITVTTAGAGIHKEFNATTSISDGTQFNFISSDVNITANTINLTTGSTDHNFQTNDLIKLSAGANTLPTGLSAGNYYVIRVDTNKIKLKTTIEGSEVDITATGTGGIVEDTKNGKTINSTSHGYANNTKVRVFGELPSELNSSNTYYIVNSTTDSFQLATTSGGSAILLTKKEGIVSIYSGISSSNFFTFDTPTGKFACWFNISGEDVPPTSSLLVGRSLQEVKIYNINIKNKENYASKIAESLYTLSDIEVSISTDSVTVLNRDGGDVLDASAAGVDASLLTISDILNGQTAIGTPANVDLSIPVPTQIINSNDKLYFFEVYRTAVVTATIGAGLDVIDPGEEFQKIYEAPVELVPEILFTDDVPESFREGGAFLYVNPISGEGILQANETPPIAHDVAVFKGSAFYANTKERHRIQFNLLATNKMPVDISYNINSTTSLSGNSILIQDHVLNDGNPVILSGTTPGGIVAGNIYYVVESVYVKNSLGIFKGVSFKLSETLGGVPVNLAPAVGTCTIQTQVFSLYVGSSSTLRKYTFIGRQRIINFTAKKPSETTNGSYFDIYSAQDRIKYRVWFDKGSATAPASDGAILLRVILDPLIDTPQSSVDSFINAFFDILDFEVYDKGSGLIRLVYTDNGDATDVTESTPATGWVTPTVFQLGLGEDASNNEVLLSGLASQGLSVEDTARSLERVINKDPLSPVNAFYLSGLNDLPGILLLEAKSLTDDAFYLGFSHTTTTAIFEPALPVAKTITAVTSASPEAIFTTSAAHGFTVGQEVYAFVDPDSTTPILSNKKIVSNIFSPSTTTFALSGFTSTTYSSFDTAIVFAADVVSDNSVNPNRVYFSKIGQPEAVPLVNYIDIGPKDKSIQRIMALRDSLVVLKEDGVYIISGSAAPNFSVRLSDSSALTFAPDTATNLNNLIYVLTSQGVVTVSETGVGVISRNIENKIQEIANAKFDYKLMSWGMASESDRCYLLWLPTKIGDMYSTQAFRYNTFTRTWTRWTKPANCGVVNPNDDKIYLGDASGRPYILKERKNFERQDFADREIVRGLGANAINGLTYTISSVAELEPGDSLVQKQYLDINKFNRFLKKLDRDTLASSNYLSSLKAAAGDNIAEKLLQVATKLQLDGIFVPTPSNSNNVDVLRADFNAIVNYLNSPGSNTGFKNYRLANDALYYEALVTSVNLRLNIVTVNQTNKFIQGDVSFFKGIKCIVQYAPQHFGKPEATKQVPDGTFIFDQNNFWGGTVAYASDRSYDFTSITFTGKGPGYWDGYSWANVTFGGQGNEVPVRTLIPRDKARCRYLHVQYTHINAREEWKLIGVSLEPREVSTRGYR